jgi:vacuolar-type H+-ATPase subunit I/STV1
MTDTDNFSTVNDSMTPVGDSTNLTEKLSKMIHNSNTNNKSAKKRHQQRNDDASTIPDGSPVHVSRQNDVSASKTEVQCSPHKMASVISEMRVDILKILELLNSLNLEVETLKSQTASDIKALQAIVKTPVAVKREENTDSDTDKLVQLFGPKIDQLIEKFEIKIRSIEKNIASTRRLATGGTQ